MPKMEYSFLKIFPEERLRASNSLPISPRQCGNTQACWQRRTSLSNLPEPELASSLAGMLNVSAVGEID